MPSPKLDWATADFVSYINGALPNAGFFLDTGVFIRKLDPAIWNALSMRRILITPGVCQELLPWLRDPFCNKAVRDAVAWAAKTEFDIPTQTRGAANVNVRLLIPDDEFTRHGYVYYLQLLALRKMMGPLASAVLTKKLGRAPTQEEFHAEVQSQFGERGYLLAKKGLEAQNSPNRLTDEHLVVTAMLTAILKGSEVVIVTRDPDVLEQYAKLCTLMKEHYRATLIAERYAANPAAYAFKDVPLHENLRACFSGNSVLEFETMDSEFNPFPRQFHFVMIYCLLVGGEPDNMKVTVSSFCAETEMAHALRLKAATNGLTTDKFGGRNCIILTEHLTPDKQKVIVLIGNERRARFGDFTPGVDDVRNTLTPNEVSMRVHYATPV